jgi:hypothetical protein
MTLPFATLRVNESSSASFSVPRHQLWRVRLLSGDIRLDKVTHSVKSKLKSDNRWRNRGAVVLDYISKKREGDNCFIINLLSIILKSPASLTVRNLSAGSLCG